MEKRSGKDQNVITGMIQSGNVLLAWRLSILQTIMAVSIVQKQDKGHHSAAVQSKLNRQE